MDSAQGAGAHNEALLCDAALVESLRQRYLALETGASNEPRFLSDLTRLGLALTTEASRLLRQTHLPTFTQLMRALKRGNEEANDSAVCFGGAPRGSGAPPPSEGVPRHLQDGAGAVMFPAQGRMERARSPAPLQSRAGVLEAARGILARVEAGTLAAHAAPAQLLALGLPVPAIPALARSLQSAQTSGRAEYSRALAACDAHLMSCSAEAAAASQPPSARAASPQGLRAGAPRAASPLQRAPQLHPAHAELLQGKGDLLTWAGVDAGAEDRGRGVKLDAATLAVQLRFPSHAGAPLAVEGYGPGLSQAALLESPSKPSARGSAGCLRGVRSPPPF